MLGPAGTVLLWVAFAVAALVEPSALNDVWGWVNDLYIVLRVIVWVLLLPYMLALLVAEQDWSLGGRAALIVLIALAHLAVRSPGRRRSARRDRERSRT